MAGGTTPDAFVPSAYLNGFIVYPGVASQSSEYESKMTSSAEPDWIFLCKGRIKMEKPYWEGKHYAFFSNKECEYFPCHAGADPENFNCLFCYCPLYALGDKCGGNFRMTEKGIKDCTNCQLPHKAQNYGYVTGKYSELAELMKKMREAEKDTQE